MELGYCQILRDGYSHGYDNSAFDNSKLYDTKRSEGRSVLVSLLFEFSADFGGLARDFKITSDKCKIRREARRSKREARRSKRK